MDSCWHVNMDNITHGILWARISGIILSEHHKTRSEPLTNGMLRAGALIANLPDLDIFVNQFIPWANPIDAFLFHRDFSHSIVFSVMMALCLGFIISRIDRSRRTWQRRSLALFCTTMIGHVLVDLMTSYGTRLLLPFSDLTFSVNNIAIVDFFFLAPLLMLFIATLVVKTTAKKRKVARLGMAFAGVYFLGTIAIQRHMTDRCITALEQKSISAEELLVQPEPLQPFLWRCVARTSSIDGETWFLEEHSSLADTSHTLFLWSILHAYVQNASLASWFADNPDRLRIKKFSEWRRRLFPWPNGTVIVDILKFSWIRSRNTTRWQNVMFGFIRDPTTNAFSRYSNRGFSVTKEDRNSLRNRVRKY